jgi:hypothetical protein
MITTGIAANIMMFLHDEHRYCCKHYDVNCAITAGTAANIMMFAAR